MLSYTFCRFDRLIFFHALCSACKRIYLPLAAACSPLCSHTYTHMNTDIHTHARANTCTHIHIDTHKRTHTHHLLMVTCSPCPACKSPLMQTHQTFPSAQEHTLLERLHSRPQADWLQGKKNTLNAVHRYAHTHAHTYTTTHAHMHTYTHARTHTLTYAHIHTHARTHIHTHPPTHSPPSTTVVLCRGSERHHTKIIPSASANGYGSLSSDRPRSTSVAPSSSPGQPPLSPSSLNHTSAQKGIRSFGQPPLSPSSLNHTSAQNGIHSLGQPPRSPTSPNQTSAQSDTRSALSSQCSRAQSEDPKGGRGTPTSGGSGVQHNTGSVSAYQQQQHTALTPSHHVPISVGQPSSGDAKLGAPPGAQAAQVFQISFKLFPFSQCSRAPV